MKKQKVIIEEPKVLETKPKTVRNKKSERRKRKTSITINESIQGDAIERMIERLREGEGEDGIQDRDLVYNDNETIEVNPVTDIRSDKFDLMLQEKIGEYEHKNRTLKVVKEDPKEEQTGTEGGENPTEE